MTKNQTRNPDGTFGPKKDTNDNNGEKTDNTSLDGFSIKFEEIPDEDTRNAIQKLLKERDFMSEEMKAMKSMLEKQEQREQQKLYEQQRSVKMEKLKQIDPRLADKYKDESDLGKLESIIESAMLLKNDFPDYEKENSEDANKKKHPTRFDPIKGEMV